jgi:GNAT superfamily N-acetyltransferase
VTVERLRDQLASERPPFECVLAERDGVPVGFALFFPTYSTWEGRPGIYLEDLYVVEEERGRGTGQALIRRVAEHAVERECGRLELAVLDWNAPAIGFYERHGGIPMSDWIVYRFAGEALRELGGDGADAEGELRAS